MVLTRPFEKLLIYRGSMNKAVSDLIILLITFLTSILGVYLSAYFMHTKYQKTKVETVTYSKYWCI